VLHLAHLEQRMRQTGQWRGGDPLTRQSFAQLLHQAIDRLDVRQAKQEVRPFLKNPEGVDVWSLEFFHQLGDRIQYV
jgi:flagellar hook-basal body complex protein FliE